MKKTQNIATMVTEETKKALQNYADLHRWTLSATVNYILEEWCKKQKASSEGSGFAAEDA